MEPTRSLNLKQTHEPHGWYVLHDEETTHGLGFKRGTIMACDACTWNGWVSAEVSEPCGG